MEVSRVLDGLVVEAGQVLLVDDQPVNIADAGQVGMRAVHFDVRDRPVSIARVMAAVGC